MYCKLHCELTSVREAPDVRRLACRLPHFLVLQLVSVFVQGPHVLHRRRSHVEAAYSPGESLPLQLRSFFCGRFATSSCRQRCAQVEHERNGGEDQKLFYGLHLSAKGAVCRITIPENLQMIWLQFLLTSCKSSNWLFAGAPQLSPRFYVAPLGYEFID